jgi:hypothetical protein
MKKKGKNVVHAGMVSNLKALAIQGNWEFATNPKSRDLSAWIKTTYIAHLASGSC